MSQFELHIDHDAFENVGVRLLFDADLYTELLRDTAQHETIEHTLGLHIAPRYDFGLTQRERWALDRQDPEVMVMNSRGGEYAAGSDEIKINVVPNIAQTNNALRHETKHWTDDIEGLLVPDLQQMVDEREARHESARYGRAALLLVDQYHYRNSPHERRAREFATDRRIRKMFGSIISYGDA